MPDIVSALIKRDQDLFLQSVFLHLDLCSLRSCTTVCRAWAEFLTYKVLSSTRVKGVLVGRLWEGLGEENHTKLVVEKSVTSIVCNRKIIVCGYNDGTGEVFANNDDGESVAKLSDVEVGFYYTGSSVQLGKDVIVKVAYASDDNNQVVNDVGVWSKKEGKRIYKSLLMDQKTCIYTQVAENNLFIK